MLRTSAWCIPRRQGSRSAAAGHIVRLSMDIAASGGAEIGGYRRGNICNRHTATPDINARVCGPRELQSRVGAVGLDIETAAAPPHLSGVPAARPDARSASSAAFRMLWCAWEAVYSTPRQRSAPRARSRTQTTAWKVAVEPVVRRPRVSRGKPIHAGSPSRALASSRAHQPVAVYPPTSSRARCAGSAAVPRWWCSARPASCRRGRSTGAAPHRCRA